MNEKERNKKEENYQYRPIQIEHGRQIRSKRSHANYGTKIKLHFSLFSFFFFNLARNIYFKNRNNYYYGYQFQINFNFPINHNLWEKNSSVSLGNLTERLLPIVKWSPSRFFFFSLWLPSDNSREFLCHNKVSRKGGNFIYLYIWNVI